MSQTPNGYWYQVRSLEAADLGIGHPVSLVFSPSPALFFTLERPAPMANDSGVGDFVIFDLHGDRAGSNRLATPLPDSLNVAFYEPTEEMFFLDVGSEPELVQVQVGKRGDRAPSGQATRRSSVQAYEVQEPQGITFDSDGGHLFVLDAAGPTILRIAADREAGFDGDTAAREKRLRRIRLDSLRDVRLRGIAYNPNNSHLYVASAEEQLIYELAEEGQVVSVLDISELNLRDPQAMVFAPSGDPTDDPAIMNLYIVDSGLSSSQTSTNGQIVELSFQQVVAPTALISASLVNVIDTSKAAWNPSSPDPAGIAYRTASGRLLIADSEVEENHPDFQGKNVFESTMSGSLVGTCDTLAFSNEPTGVAVNPNNGRIFFSDDNNDMIYVVNLVDGIYCNGNDTVTSLSTRTFNSQDPEGIAYGNNSLFIADGVGAEVYVVNLGANGVIGGADDTLVTQFDTFSLGLRDPEGIEYNPDSNTLFIASTTSGDNYIVETTTTGAVVNTYDLSFLGTPRRSGLAYGPGSQNSAVKNIYMASRGVDNDSDPNENDGKVYEIALGQSGPMPTSTNTAALTNTPGSIRTRVPTNTPGPALTATPTSTVTLSPTPRSIRTRVPTSTPGPALTATPTPRPTRTR